MAILLDVLPPKRHARISLVWTVCLMLGIASGASIGGWLSEYHGWRSIFYISLPMSGFIFLAVGLSLPEKKAEQNPPFDSFGLATFSLGMIGLQMLDRGERLEWFASAEIWVEAIASVLGFYLYIVHILTAKAHFLDKALFKDRNFVLSTIMFFAFGFILLPTLALTSPMLEQLLNYPVDTTGYMTIPRGVTLVGGLVLVSFVPAWIDNRLFVVGGMALVVYGNWRMLGYSPAMDWRPAVVAGALQGLDLGTLMPALTKAAFSTLDPKFRPEGTALFNLSRLYGSTIGIAVVQVFFYNNTQAVHVALAKDLTPYRAAAHAAGSISRPRLAALNDMVTGQAAVIAVIDQFEILVFAMLIVSPLVLFLRKPRLGFQRCVPAYRTSVLSAGRFGSAPARCRRSTFRKRLTDRISYFQIPQRGRSTLEKAHDRCPDDWAKVVWRLHVIHPPPNSQIEKLSMQAPGYFQFGSR
jgi:MFS transporter, DHA2 family, multidrug resistance protein